MTKFALRLLANTGVFLCLVQLSLIPCWGKDFPNKDAVMWLPTGLVSTSAMFEYERGFGNYMGLGLRGTLTPRWEWKGGKSGDDDDYDWIYQLKGGGVGVSARFYPWGNAPQGFHIGPRADFLTFQGTYEDRAKNLPAKDVAIQISTLHLETGYKFAIRDRFIISPFVDAGVPFTKSDDSGARLLATMAYVIGGGVYLGWCF